nr:unnamed protein product [Callosobruchus analis]
MINITEYSSEHFSIEYILCGKFQTDNLEKRFGRYRLLSGCNYNISFNQILESEKKIRIQNILKTCNTQLDLKEIRNSFTVEGSHTALVDISKFLFILETDYFTAYHVDEAVQAYICGYVGYSLVKKITCKKCSELLIKSKGIMLELDYFNYLQRGGLSIATDEIGYIYHHVCAIFTYITNNESIQNMFFNQSNHQNILATIIKYTQQ